MSTELPNHSHSGSFNNGLYTALVSRTVDHWGRRPNYTYDVLITRVSDGRRARISLSTFRKYASIYGTKTFPGYRFNDWLLNRSAGIAPVVKAAEPVNDVEIDVETTRSATLNIKISLNKTGDAEELADEVRDIISQLEDALRDLEDY
jgi:hypothetical protein